MFFFFLRIIYFFYLVFPLFYSFSTIAIYLKENTFFFTMRIWRSLNHHGKPDSVLFLDKDI